MAKATLYHGHLMRSMRPLWMFKEIQLAYENRKKDHIPVFELYTFDREKFRTVKPDWYLAINPNGKVPTYVDEKAGITMRDGTAISLFMLQTYDVDGLLFPSSESFRAKFLKLSCYCSGTVDNLSATSSPIQMCVENKLIGEEEELKKINYNAWKNLSGLLLENELGDNLYMFGNEFTALDVIVGYNLTTLHHKRNWLKSEFPVLFEYYKRIFERPAFQEATGHSLSLEE